MLKANQLFVFLLQLNLYGFCEPNRSFLSVPKSAIVKIRANVSLECVVFNSTNKVFWNFYNVSHNNDETKIYSQAGFTEQMKSRYRINNETRGHYNLVIDPADHGHAGRYICKDYFFSSQAIAEINVIDSDPVCGMNVTNMANDQTVLLRCEINSTGFLIPQMKWTKGNGELINSTTQSTVINGSTMTTTSFVRLQIQPQDNNAMERITVKCTTSFMWKNGSTEGVPHYEHVWNHNLPLATEKDATSETVSVSYTQKAFATADPSPPQLEAWIIPFVGGSIFIIILIILYIVFQYRKKKKKGSTSSTALPLNAGSSGNTENTNREAEGKRLPKTQREKVEHGTENVEVYETFADRPTTPMQSDTYCELNMTEQEKSKTKSTRTIETYETLANRPSASMQSETYCELNLLKQDEPKSKPLSSAVLEDERQEYHTIGDEYQTIDDYETLANRPSPAVQSETYCELQIVKKKKDKKK